VIYEHPLQTVWHAFLILIVRIPQNLFAILQPRLVYSAVVAQIVGCETKRNLYVTLMVSVLVVLIMLSVPEILLHTKLVILNLELVLRINLLRASMLQQ